MKKRTIVSMITSALVIGAASTTFAAANPFSDATAGHMTLQQSSLLTASSMGKATATLMATVP